MMLGDDPLHLVGTLQGVNLPCAIRETPGFVGSRAAVFGQRVEIITRVKLHEFLKPEPRVRTGA